MEAKWCSDCRIEYDEARCPRCVDRGSMIGAQPSRKFMAVADINQRRLEVAKVLLAGMMSNSGQYQMHTKDKMIAEAIELADSLLAALKDLK